MIHNEPPAGRYIIETNCGSHQFFLTIGADGSLREHARRGRGQTWRGTDFRDAYSPLRRWWSRGWIAYPYTRLSDLVWRWDV